MTPQPSSFFSSSFAQARDKFRTQCADIGLDVAHYPHPEIGREGEELATDVAWIGPADASHILFTMSATHGVEGFCGSGVQIGALRCGHYQQLPPGVAVVLIHAINPYGFSWLRRVTHENVDLNRNHVDHDQPYPANPGYDSLRHAICPTEWTTPARTQAQATLDEYAKEHGALALQAAVSQGQYSHPQGLFFGGNEPTWSARTLANLVERYSARARHVAMIDYHTGLGPYGYGELISDHVLSDAGHDRLRAWLGGDQVTSTDDGSSSSAALTGVNSQCVRRAAAHASLTMVTLEFGTSPVPEVLDALRADCWLHNRGELDSDLGRAIKNEIRRCFYPDADDWKDMVWQRSTETERKMLEGLAALS